jgi:predicted nuclease with TOPRIM domain
MGQIDFENSLIYVKGMLTVMEYVTQKAHVGSATMQVNSLGVQALRKVLEEIELSERKLDVARSHIDHIYVPEIKKLEEEVKRYKGEVEELGKRLDRYES